MTVVIAALVAAVVAIGLWFVLQDNGKDDKKNQPGIISLHRLASGRAGYSRPMKVIVLGASGNIGTALLRQLRQSAAHDVVAVHVVSRRPRMTATKSSGVRWTSVPMISSRLFAVPMPWST